MLIAAKKAGTHAVLFTSSIFCLYVRLMKPKVAGSNPDSVTGIFQCHNPSGRAMVLGVIQPVTEMGTRNVVWRVKAAGA